MPNPQAQVKHPSPDRYQVSTWKLWISMLGVPLLWIAQIATSEIAASYACYPHDMPLDTPLWQWLTPLLIGISAASLLLAIICMWLAYTAWKQSRHEDKGSEKHTVDIGEGRTRFLAMVGLLSSGLFLIAILFTACALWLVSPCNALA